MTTTNLFAIGCPTLSLFDIIAIQDKIYYCVNQVYFKEKLF